MSVLTFVFLFPLCPRLLEKVRLGQPRRGNQAGSAVRGGGECDEQMQIGDTNGGGGI